MFDSGNMQLEDLRCTLHQCLRAFLMVQSLEISYHRPGFLRDCIDRLAPSISFASDLPVW